MFELPVAIRLGDRTDSYPPGVNGSCVDCGLLFDNCTAAHVHLASKLSAAILAVSPTVKICSGLG